MNHEGIYLGIAAIIFGIGIIIKTKTFLVSLIPLIIGIALIIFSKNENKIEKRNDEK
jgi:hypothetical protein